MTTNLHDKMLAAIDAYFSASNEIEAHIAEEQLLDVRAEINNHKLAAKSLTEGLRLDDWAKIGCVNHDCDKCKAQQEPVKLSGYELDGRRYKTMEERLKDAFYEGFTSSATYNDIELNDVDEEWLKYAAAHGINTKGNT